MPRTLPEPKQTTAELIREIETRRNELLICNGCRRRFFQLIPELSGEFCTRCMSPDSITDQLKDAMKFNFDYASLVAKG